MVKLLVVKPRRLRGPKVLLLCEQPALVPAYHAGQQAAAGRDVDDRPVGDPGDHAGVLSADREWVDVEALQAHLDVTVLDRREHLLRYRNVFLDDVVAALGVLLDDPVP